MGGFSPLAGIRYVETYAECPNCSENLCFSPLAGIRYVETISELTKPQYQKYVSVPLRGLDMWKQVSKEENKVQFLMFQSPCGD